MCGGGLESLILALKSEVVFYEFEDDSNRTSEVEKNDISPSFVFGTEG